MRPPGRAPAQVPGEPFAKRYVTVNDLRSLRPHVRTARVDALQGHDRTGISALLLSWA